MSRQRSRALLTTRSALIFVITFLVAASAGTLTYMSTHTVAEALMAAGVAAGGSLGLLPTIIE
jgi:uncharacterized membrane protein